MVVYRRIVVDLILFLILPFKLFYLFCFFPPLGKMMHFLTWGQCYIYIFIYLVPFLLQASIAAAMVFLFSPFLL